MEGLRWKIDFLAPQVERLKRCAKELQRADSTITQMQALNQVAREHGFINWAVLAKNSLPAADELLRLSACWLESVDERMRLSVEMKVANEHLLEFSAERSATFELPERIGWLFHAAATEYEHSLYLDLQHEQLLGTFVNGHWRAILAVNTIEVPEAYEYMVATLPHVLRDLKVSAFVSLLPDIAQTAPTAAGGRIRMFFARTGQNGAPEIGERDYATLEEAKASELPEHFVKVGIPLKDGAWLRYRPTLGWSA